MTPNKPINKLKMNKAVQSAIVNNNTTVYSPDGLRILRYLDHTVIGFKRGRLAAAIIENVMMERHPTLWDAVCTNLPAHKGGRVKCPSCGECFFVGRHASASEQEIPVLGPIDANALACAKDELETRTNRIVSVYSTRATAVLRYMSLTETKFRISREAADLLEIGLNELYPRFFKDDVK